MPKYYCDYCDTHLTHDSPSVRKTHCEGRKHRDNVRNYYQKWVEQEAQHLIDVTTAAYKLKSNMNPSNGFLGEAIANNFQLPPPGLAMDMMQQMGNGEGLSNMMPGVFNFPTCFPPPNMLNAPINSEIPLPTVPLMVPPTAFDSNGAYILPN